MNRFTLNNENICISIKLLHKVNEKLLNRLKFFSKVLTVPRYINWLREIKGFESFMSIFTNACHKKKKKTLSSKKCILFTVKENYWQLKFN